MCAQAQPLLCKEASYCSGKSDVCPPQKNAVEGTACIERYVHVDISAEKISAKTRAVNRTKGKLVSQEPAEGKRRAKEPC